MEKITFEMEIFLFDMNFFVQGVELQFIGGLKFANGFEFLYPNPVCLSSKFVGATIGRPPEILTNQ